jgi:hypothetical protein
MIKKKPASTATKKVAAAKVAKSKKTKNPLTLLAPGDAVRLSLRVHNRFSGYDPRQKREDSTSRQIEGIILAIREIATGKLAALASGDFSQYVLEVIHNRSFDPSFASTQNAGKVIPGERGRISPLWQKVQQAIKQMAKEHKLVSISGGGFSGSPISGLLDGFRVVKVRADEIEALEQ